MTTNAKLTKVLEYLIKNEEEKAKELLHQVFIEKARAIHEELMSADEESEMDEMHDHIGGSGDMSKDLTMEIDDMDNEIDAEETMEAEGDDMPADDMSADDAMSADTDSEMPMGDGEPAAADANMSPVENKLDELQAALDALKAEFDKLESDADSEDSEEVDVDVTDDDGELEVDVEDTSDDEEDDEEEDDEEEEEEDDEEEEEMDESWDLDEEFDDLAESLDLEVVTKDMEKSAKTPADVGSASSGMSVGKDAKSPLPKSQTERMGAKPVETGKGPTHKGYNLETAPKSDRLQGTDDNRRKKATQDMKKMSKEGVPGAKLNHPEPAVGKSMSPLSRGGDNLKGK